MLSSVVVLSSVEEVSLVVTVASNVEIGTTTVSDRSPSRTPARVTDVELPFESGEKYITVSLLNVD